jgi:hypothetical protein
VGGIVRLGDLGVTHDQDALVLRLGVAQQEEREQQPDQGDRR